MAMAATVGCLPRSGSLASGSARDLDAPGYTQVMALCELGWLDVAERTADRIGDRKEAALARACLALCQADATPERARKLVCCRRAAKNLESFRTLPPKTHPLDADAAVFESVHRRTEARADALTRLSPEAEASLRKALAAEWDDIFAGGDGVDPALIIKARILKAQCHARLGEYASAVVELEAIQDEILRREHSGGLPPVIASALCRTVEEARAAVLAPEDGGNRSK